MRSPSKWLQAGKTLGILLMLGPIFGFFGTAFEYWRMFGAVGDHGINDPRALSNAVSGALVINAVGICVVPLGVILFFVSRHYIRRLQLSGPPPLPPQAA